MILVTADESKNVSVICEISSITIVIGDSVLYLLVIGDVRSIISTMDSLLNISE